MVMKFITKNKLEAMTMELLNSLQERPRKVLVKRFGLRGGKSYTLDAIGKEFGITRERVRQIEKTAFTSLRKKAKSDDLQQAENFVYDTLKKGGGFLDRGSLKRAVFGKRINLKQRNQLAFLFNSLGKLHYQKDTIPFSGVWYLSFAKREVGQLKNFNEKLVNYFQKEKRVLKFSEIKKAILNGDLGEEFKKMLQGEKGEEKLKVVLSGSKLIGKNIMGEWGLLSWSIVSQKYVKERALLILRKEKQPLHFRELTELINKQWQDKRTLPQTVHNVIIKYEEFIFVKPGTYTVIWSKEDAVIKNR
jgi:hypothetical protein